MKEWVFNIFLMIAILSFVELALPDGAMQKYIKFIFSLVILGVIISPFGKIDFNEISAFTNYYEDLDQDTVFSDSGLLDRITTVQTKQLQQVYQERLDAEKQDRNNLQNDGISIPWTDIYSIDGEDEK